MERVARETATTPLERWASFSVPTLVIAGGASSARQRHAVLAALVDVLPDVRHRTSEGQDHGPDTEVLASALEGVLHRLMAGGGCS